MKIVTVIGARPQFIKASVVSKAIKARDDLKEIIIHTGQHYDANMSDVFFDQMGIPKPDYQFDINNTSHGAMTGKMLEEIEKVLLTEAPDMVLVYGDTNSTLAGALAASKLHIPVAHVEAGLRSYNMKMPEEVNRIVTDRLSCILFCPSNQAVENLGKEGFEGFDIDIHVIGDVMKDSSAFFAKEAKVPSSVDGDREGFFLCTIHRPENTDTPENLKSIIEALNEVHTTNAPVIMPLHPRTKKMIDASGLELKAEVIAPVGYQEMLWLIDKSKGVLTDSGGLQKEAYFFEKPCITLRNETEWVELVETGANIIVGADKDKIVSAASDLSQFSFSNMGIYGDGNASEKIAEILSQFK